MSPHAGNSPALRAFSFFHPEGAVMTSSTRSAILTSVVATVSTMIGTIVLAIATGAWAGKENVSDHRADVERIVAKMERIRDVVCLDHRYAPQCQPIQTERGTP